MDEESVKAATEKSRKKGYLDGAQLAEVFAWLRPNDLVWNYWVNNYLQGKPPPNFDILYWNADTTRMTAGLHRDFIDIADRQRPDHARAGRRCSARRSTCPRSPSTPTSPPASPTTSARGSPATARTQLLGGESRFVLSTSGHIASLVNPPGNPKSTFQVGGPNPADAEEWLAGADTVQGSWWPDFMTWLGERSGEEVPASSGSAATTEELAPAPGTYVFDK